MNIGRRLGKYGRRLAARERNRLQGRDGVPGLLSVVVPVYNVEQFLDECLRSLRFQSYERVEIIVVDDGSPDDSISIAKHHAVRDPRVRIIRRPNGGLSAARNTGVAAARGEFLAFVDSDDTVPVDGYRTTMKRLSETGSQFAVFQYRRIKREVNTVAAPWIREAHRESRLRTNLAEYPDILVNAMACSKVIRTSTWRELGLSFVEGITYEDQIFSPELYARAESFDVLNVVGYNWRRRDDGSSLSQGQNDIRNLRSRLVAADQSLEILDRLGPPVASIERVIQILSNDIPQFIRYIADSDPEYWALMSEGLQNLIDRLDRSVYVRRVPAQYKVLYHLVRTGQREATRRFLVRDGLSPSKFKVGREPVGHVGYLPLWDEDDADVPAECFVLSYSQLVTKSVIRRIRRTSRTSVHVSGWVYIQHIDLAQEGQSVRATARSEGHADVPLTVTQFADDEIDEYSSGYCDYRRAAFGAEIDLEKLPEGSWEVVVDVAADGGERSTVWSRPWEFGSAAVAHPVAAGEGLAAVVRADVGRPLAIDVYEATLSVEDYEYDGGVLTVTLRGPQPDSLALRRSPGGVVLTGDVSEGSSPDLWTARFDLGELAVPGLRRSAPQPSTRWSLLAERSGETLPVRSRPLLRAWDRATPDAESSVGESGCWLLRTWRESAVVRSVEVGADRVAVDLEARHIVADDYDVLFESKLVTVSGSLSVTAEGRLRVLLPFRQERWGVPDRVVPSASYQLNLVHRETGQRVVPRLDWAVVDAIPRDALLDDVRVKVHLRGPVTRSLVVAVKAPLPLEARGSRNQGRLRRVANNAEEAHDSVFFRTLYGEVTNDSARAIHEELRRRGSDLTLFWSIKDRSVDVPEGGVGLVEGSPEWYAELGAARYLVLNIHQPEWYRKPGHQQIIETFHGYPYKQMGQTWWAQTDLAVSRVASYLERSSTWDHLVSPAAYATPLLLTEFFRPADADRVNVLEVGYPRNDVLLSPEAPKIGRQVRDALGIEDGTTVVLYAPTFRDYFSVDGMTARKVDFFDAHAAARALGDRYVFLVRGHAFNARAKDVTTGGDQVIDVTHYPDVTDLCLASDAAILDYSSLRFDYALTRKPMLFLVPDVKKYHAMRPGLLDFDATSPGPHLSTTGQVVEHLRHLSQVHKQYAPAVETFIGQYMEQEDGQASARVVDAVFGPPAS